MRRSFFSLGLAPLVAAPPRGRVLAGRDGAGEGALLDAPGLDYDASCSPHGRMVGDSLSVGAVLEGSVRRLGERVRVTVQLVRTTDGSHLWSDTCEREYTDIFDIQDEIARKQDSRAAALADDVPHPQQPSRSTISRMLSWAAESRASMR